MSQKGQDRPKPRVRMAALGPLGRMDRPVRDASSQSEGQPAEAGVRALNAGRGCFTVQPRPQHRGPASCSIRTILLTPCHCGPCRTFTAFTAPRRCSRPHSGGPRTPDRSLQPYMRPALPRQGPHPRPCPFPPGRTPPGLAFLLRLVGAPKQDCWGAQDLSSHSHPIS